MLFDRISLFANSDSCVPITAAAVATDTSYSWDADVSDVWFRRFSKFL